MRDGLSKAQKELLHMVQTLKGIPHRTTWIFKTPESTMAVGLLFEDIEERPLAYARFTKAGETVAVKYYQ